MHKKVISIYREALLVSGRVEIIQYDFWFIEFLEVYKILVFLDNLFIIAKINDVYKQNGDIFR